MSDNITGKVVNVEFEVDQKKQAGGTYKAWRLVYESGSGSIQTVAKPMGTLKYNPALKNGLDELSPGDSFVMEREKEDGFLNPTKVYKGTAPTQASAPVQATAAPKAASGPNTFEVNNQLKEKQMKFDEARQPIYVRQTALKAASELADVLKLKNEQAVLDQAQRFVKFIETGDSGSIEDMISDDLDIQ